MTYDESGSKSPSHNQTRELVEVKVMNIEMSFMAMVTFMVKLAFATIPAAIIIFIISAITWGAIGALFKH
jgi:hypothetical protein